MHGIESNLAALRLTTGDADGASEILRRLLDEPDLPTRSLAHIGTNLALAELTRGNLHAAEATIDRVEAWNADVGRVETTQFVHLIQALIAMERDDARAARIALMLARRTVDGPVPGEHATTIFAVSAVQAAPEQLDDATEWLDRARALGGESSRATITLAASMVTGEALPPTFDRTEFDRPVKSTLYRILKRRRGVQRRLTITEDGRWFRAGSEWHDLRRRGPMRLMIRALADGRSGEPIDAISLFEASWPDDEFDAVNSVNRVYATLHRLRGLGLEDFIVTTDDGYQLADDVEVVVGEREEL
jgi:hypothetical protein